MSIPNSGTVLNTGDVQKVLFKRPSFVDFCSEKWSVRLTIYKPNLS